MQRTILKNAQRYSFWFSLLIHSALLIYFLFHFSFSHYQNTENHELPNLTIPSYIYQQETESLTQPKVLAKKIRSLPNGILKEKESIKAMPTLSSHAVNTVPASSASEPINLVGTKNIRKPLLELLGKALARTLVYPKIALDFNLRGIAYVGFTLQPNGQLNDVRLIKSSGTAVLDQAALRGVAAISPVKNVNQFLKETKLLVVGIIFR